MAIPDYQTLMLPVLTAAKDGDQKVATAANQIANKLGLSEAEREQMLPSGKQRLFHNRIHWAKFYLTKAGLLDSPSRGVFRITQTGRDLLLRRPAKIDLETLKQYSEFAEYYAQFAGKAAIETTPIAVALDAPDDTPEEQIDKAHSALTAVLKADLVGRVLENSPSFFEHVIVELLVAMGYGGSHEDAARRLGKSGDGGIDGIIDEDRLGLDRIYVQAKRYALANSVGRPEIQGFVGSLVGQGASKGVFVTTSNFSRQALDYAAALQQRVILIDGARLSELMVEFGVGVRVSRVVEVKRLDEDFFEGFE